MGKISHRISGCRANPRWIILAPEYPGFEPVSEIVEHSNLCNVYYDMENLSEHSLILFFKNIIAAAMNKYCGDPP